jgi:phosphoribosylaminoimidazole-succinocarboxamide synthase
VPLPPGLNRADKLPDPIFTPTTKAHAGHDEPLTYEQACDLAGRKIMDRLSRAAIEIYKAGSEYAAKQGTILADTKFEFGWALDARGRPTDELLLIDEVLTPDSSRYWPADRWQPGREQESFDKQYVRDYLQRLCDEGRWDKSPPGPALPPDVVANTLKRYVEVRDRLFG